MASSDLETFTPPSAGHAQGRPRRIGLWALAIGFGALAIWAAFAPLDEGVPSQGLVAIDTKRKPVQHLTGGLIKEVLVGEGAQVSEGQLLMRLDQSVMKSEFESARQRYLGLKAMQARLLAEQSGSPVKFSADLQEESKDPLIKQQMVNQEQLLQSRKSALRSDLQAIEESVQGQLGQLQAYKEMLTNRNSQKALIQEQLARIKDLVQDGYAPRNTQLDLERQLAESHASIADLQGMQVRTTRSVAELKQRANSRLQEYNKEVESQLADVSRELPGDLEKFNALKESLSRTDIRAPASGQVVGLAAQTVGAIVGPGQKIMDIVPANEALTLEIRVMPQLIDRVETGLPVDIRFSAFAHTPQLVVDGKVMSVSGDLLTEQQTGISYFLARVAVTPEGLKKLGKHQLQPGMPVDVVFKTGERSLLTYLLHPLTKRLAASMKEE